MITDPNVAFILMIVGLFGLVFEFSTPGAVAPGVIGAICLVLGLYALNMLPVDYTGLALMLLGIALPRRGGVQADLGARSWAVFWPLFWEP